MQQMKTPAVWDNPKPLAFFIHNRKCRRYEAYKKSMSPR
ncbi:MAG: hypothetical protein ACJAVP_000039 [Spirosomataceae bacterium]|jgi:hypothetical protein